MTDSSFKDRSALVVGMGGLGCPAALALARAGVGRLILCDDDEVDASNLHRQILYRPSDVGRSKLDAARDALIEEGAQEVELVRTRFLPENSLSMVSDADVVIEGADNFATKFLAADTCHLAGRPVVHGACVRFLGTAWSVGPGGRPCYRCLFEDLLPDDEAPNCTGAGVFGPVVGVMGALMADLALDALKGVTDRVGTIFSFDGKRELLRSTAIRNRPECPLCGTDAGGLKIREISRHLYSPTTPLEARLRKNSSANSSQLNA